MTKTEFLLTTSIQYQPDKWWVINCAFSFLCLRKLAAKVIRNVSSCLVSCFSAVGFTGMISISSFFLGSKCEENQSNFETEHKKTHKKTQTKQNIINYLTALLINFLFLSVSYITWIGVVKFHLLLGKGWKKMSFMNNE